MEDPETACYPKFFLFQGWGTGSTGSCNVGSGTDALLVVSTESSPAMHSGYC